ncbi:hypothetical protein BC826DRAFT_1104786 [Russula brevipes]|nr:hypothetical protein BC826DRAFT_1104786 [Russula brevipes]
MSLPPIFSLSNELLIEIIAHLSPDGIDACRQTCRQLNEIITNSQLIQYALRTALSGVFELRHAGLSLPERLDALQRWESAWAEMDLREPNVRIDAPVPSRRGHSVQFSFGRYFVVIREGYGRPAGYSFLDMHASFTPHADVARWTTIEIDVPNVLVFAFASELDLAVAISCGTHRSGPLMTTLKIYPMWFGTGKPHPLASRPTLEVAVAGASAYNLSDTEVIGDYILFWVGGPIYAHTQDGTLCNIYLVAWKEGWVTELRSAIPGVYGSVLSVLSEEIVLLIRLHEPGLELCRLSNISDPSASLDTVCILSLPEFNPGASLRWATSFGEHPGHALFSKKRHPAPDGTPRCPWVRPAGRKAGERAATYGLCRGLHPQHGNAPPRDSRADAETGTGMRPVPWEEWGPANTRILEHDSLTWGSLVGERRAMVGRLRPTTITMRDYNPFRVRRALARTGGRPGAELKLKCGSVIRVVDDASVYPGGEWFREDVETSLPYVETVTPYPRCEGIFMDEDNLLVEARTEVRG